MYLSELNISRAFYWLQVPLRLMILVVRRYLSYQTMESRARDPSFLQDDKLWQESRDTLYGNQCSPESRYDLPNILAT